MMMMVLRTARIKTFELIGDTSDLADMAEDFFWADEPLASTAHDFCMRHAFPHLGQEMDRTQTRGMRCARVYYDRDGMPLFMKMYDERGTFVASVLLSDPVGDDIDLAQVYAPSVRTVSLVDVQGILAGLAPGATELVFKQGGRVFTMEKVGPHRLDLHARDARARLREHNWAVAAFNDRGWREIRWCSLDVDGVVRLGVHFEYDAEGRPLRELFYEGSPWGGISPSETVLWSYGPKPDLVVSRRLEKNSRLTPTYYDLDQEGRIARRRVYLPAGPNRSDDPSDESKAAWPAWSVTIDYHYNDAGRLDREVCRSSDPVCTGMEQFDYDGQGRLVRWAEFRADGTVWKVTEYTYPAPLEMEVSTYFNHSPDLFPDEDD